jgi:hypothetical protein
MEWVEHTARMGEEEEEKNVYRGSVGKTEGKRPLRRPKHIREDNIVTYLCYMADNCGFWIR